MTSSSIPSASIAASSSLASLSLPEKLRQGKQAFYAMSALPTAQKNQALETFARLLKEHRDRLLEANQRDLQENATGLAPSLYQRLKLDETKIQTLIQGLQDVVALPDPVGAILRRTQLDEGLVLEKQRVPLGLVAIIFESRPDVLPQILSLILKSGNTVIFKGGSEAAHSNRAFMQVVSSLEEACPFLPKGWAQLLETRADVQELLNYPEFVDLVIPRGSNALVQQIMATTRIPVLGHADGICHVYVDASAPVEMALSVVLDSKTQYPSACNALETLLVHTSLGPVFLPVLAEKALELGITLKADALSRKFLPAAEAATELDWKTEYGDLILAVKQVDSLAEAISHINTYGSHHTDAIVSLTPEHQQRFQTEVDSANVYVNASTRFADGFRYGFGAEIGISTSKTHARGPVGLEGLMSYKYRLVGQGHVVSDYSGATPKAQFQHKNLSVE
jgi:glutamate-5-semialdehyde dehydrogenase